jgi:aspartyl-tRNA(Asn)/glutamyl-tRNA(Gln) amidotransferase subunit C
MSLTLDDVKRISALAHLEFNSDQAENTLAQLNNIFTMVEQMSAVDTQGVEPLSHPISIILPDLALRLRNDEATEPNQRQENQQSAPATQDGLYLVPQVID